MNLTFVFLKPDALSRGLVYTVMNYFFHAGITVRAVDIQTVKPEIICAHYAEHIQKYGADFKRQTLDMFEGKQVMPAILEGKETVVEDVRAIVGATQPAKAEKGTIRGDLGLGDSYEISVPEGRLVRNLIHASDAKEAVRAEAGLWLPQFSF
ncbi:MAG: nucleoside-diphosphate kinase [Ethanoligenens sp.]|uniref:nucleoside-diphosphate kinase n=1 Tax=Ethanoligenens sp. TaxID=2099655 RepID=UPI0039EB9505